MTTANPDSPRLTASIVLYHSDLERLDATLDSLDRAVEQAVGTGELAGAELLLVDNSIEEDYREAVSKRLSSQVSGRGIGVRYLPSTRNLGFGGGHNLALEQAEGEYFLVLNPDVELAPDSLQQALARLRREPDVILLSPRVWTDKGQQEYLCKRYPSVLVLFLRAFAPAWLQRPFARRLADYEARDLCGDRAVEVPLASGCFMLLRSADLQRLRGFDEDYFLYFEDFDLSLRAAGLGRVLYDPAVSIVHHGGYAARKGLRHIALFFTAGLRFFRCHGWRWI